MRVDVRGDKVRITTEPSDKLTPKLQVLQDLANELGYDITLKKKGLMETIECPRCEDGYINDKNLGNRKCGKCYGTGRRVKP